MIRKIYILFFISSFSLFAFTDFSNNHLDNINCTNCYEPVSNAGENLTYFKTGFVTLDGSGSYDPENQEMTYHWSAPAGIELNDSTLITPTFTAPDVDGSTDYVIELIVNDGDYNSAPDSVVITVVPVNTEPVISGIVTELTVNRNDSFILDASSSYDSTLTGTLSFSYAASDFEIGSGSGLSSPVVEFIAPNVSQDETFYINLVVSDGDLSDSVVVEVNVIANLKPVVVLGEDFEVPKGANFILDGSSSYDLDGEISSYTWYWSEACDAAGMDDGVCSDGGTCLSGLENEPCLTDDDCDSPLPLSVIDGQVYECPFDESMDCADGATLTITAPNSELQCDFYLRVNDGTDNSDENPTKDLFISEYVEAQVSGNSYLEIYNGTDSAVDLSDYYIEIARAQQNQVNDWGSSNNYFSGPLSGILNSHQVLIIARSASTDIIEFGNDGFLNSEIVALYSDGSGGFEGDGYDDIIQKMSGDEGVGLFKYGSNSNQLIDAIGRVPGIDPGAEWEVGDGADAEVGTKDNSLVRLSQIYSGTSNWSMFNDGQCNDSDGNTLTSDYGCAQWDAYDRNIYDYGGWHVCSTCDAKININFIENLNPIANAGSDFNAVSGYEIFVDGSLSSDPDTPFENLIFQWISDDVELINSNSVTASFMADELGEVELALIVSDGASADTSNISVTVIAENSPPTTNLAIVNQYYDLNANGIQEQDEFAAYVDKAFENRTVYLDASGSFDVTATGQLIFDWIAPSGFELNDSTISNPSFTVPEFIGSDQVISFTLNLSDGDLVSSSIIEVNLEARMPILISNQMEFSSSETDTMFFDLSSSNDPDHPDLDTLKFIWSSPTNVNLLGVCYDENGQISNPVSPCDSDSCLNTDICMQDKPYNFAVMPKSIGEDRTYTIEVRAEDNGLIETYFEFQGIPIQTQVSSQTLELPVNVQAEYPVANAGSDFNAVSGSVVTLSAYLSEDPQEHLTDYKYWDGESLESEEINFITFYKNSNLSLLDGYSVFWQSNDGVALSDPTLVNPTFVAPGLLGDYEFELTITDPDEKVSNSDKVKITIVGNEPPVADAGENARVLSGSFFLLDGSNSSDATPTGNFSYLWRPIDSEIEIGNDDSEFASFIAPSIDFGQETTLQFELTVNDGELSSIDTVEVVAANYSRPISPNLYARSDDKKVTLFWDNVSEFAIDSLTKYSDFQGYRIYRSQDYGQTWGPIDSLVFNTEGDTLGWKPFKIYDLSEDSDTSLCVYKYDFLDCAKSRGLEISGADPYQSWYNLGNNSGLSQTFVDTNVINGIDYTYSITAYDRGLRPDTLEFGSYGDAEEDFGEDEETWYPGVPDHVFEINMDANLYLEKKLSYEIDSSYVDSLTSKHVYKLLAPDGVSDGDAVWSIKRNAPSSNPDLFGMYISRYSEYIGQKALESLRGESIEDNNYVVATPGKIASDISFPDEEDLDEFIASDCKAVGNGDIFYEIVNVSDLSKGLLKMEVQSSYNNVPTQAPFEGYAMEDACVYSYPVIRIEVDDKPFVYMPAYSETYEPIQPSELNKDELTDSYYYQLVGDLETVRDMPGVIINEDVNPPTIIYPDYLLECHELEYIDDPNYQNNWSDFFSGIRMRFDNALRLYGDGNAALDEVYSYPDSSFADVMFDNNFVDGILELQYYGNTEFRKKPNYEYEVEFFKESYPDTAVQVSSTTQCPTPFKTLLPFRVKNLTTGKYVKLSHSDLGIWGGDASLIPSWFTGSANTHPGYGDCVWQPGEPVSFISDSVSVGVSSEVLPQTTSTLKLYYPPEVINYTIDDFCPITNGQPSYTDFSTTSDYSGGQCVYHEGLVWFATEDIYSQQIGVEEQSFTNEDTEEVTTIEVPIYYEPNLWDDSDNDGVNDNKWIPVYSWMDQTKLVIKPKKWFVDGDYWIADMSILGREEEVTDKMLGDIRVVPNPYIVSSSFGEDTHGSRLMFTNLVSNCKITIYTIMGEIVDILNHDGGGSTYWDLKNQNGNNVAPGLYIFRAESESGLDFVGKFAVVR